MPLNEFTSFLFQKISQSRKFLGRNDTIKDNVSRKFRRIFMVIPTRNYYIEVTQTGTKYNVVGDAAKGRIHEYATLLDEAKEYKCAKLQCCLCGTACSIVAAVTCNTPISCILGELATYAISRRLSTHLDPKVNETREAVKAYILENPLDFPEMTQEERRSIKASWKWIPLDIPEIIRPSRAQPSVDFLDLDPLLSDQDDYRR